jgi:hypothetical protein
VGLSRRIAATLVCALGCAQTTADAVGDGGVDALVLDADCNAIDAIDLRAVGTRANGVITLQVDTRDAPWNDGASLPRTPCAPRRVRARVYAYTAEGDGPVQVTSPSLRVEVFRDCRDGFALLGCGDGLGLSLRGGQRVYLVVSSDPFWRYRSGGDEGYVRVERGPFLAEGERCDVPREPAAFCGPGLGCGARGRCTPRLPRHCRPERDDCGPEQICRDTDGGGTGICVDAAGSGERCNDRHLTSLCARGLVCTERAFGRWSVCAPPGRLGERCVSGWSADRRQDTHCTAGLRCDAWRRCVPLAREGEACTSQFSTQCTEGLVCVANRCVPLARTPYGACEGARRNECPEDTRCDHDRCFPSAPVREGGRCNWPSPRCAPGLACEFGQCAVPGGVGTLCTDDRICDPGLRCSTLGRCARDGTRGERCREGVPRCDGADVCVNGLCTPKVDPDACADRSNDGALCAEDRVCFEGSCGTFGVVDGPCTPRFARDRLPPCPDGSVCSRDGRCTRPLPAGSMCSSLWPDDSCGLGARCDVDTCRLAGTVNAHCRPGERGPRCDAGLRCQFERCVPATLDAGARCDARTAACREGLDCADIAFTCTAPGTAGGNCRADDPPCDAGLRCVGTDRTRWCAAPRARGEPCNEPQTWCRDGDSCGANGVCGPVGREGARCRDASPWCDDGLACDRNLRCARVLPDGAPCAASAMCRETSYCINGRCADVSSAHDGRGYCRLDGSCDGARTCVDEACRQVLASGAPCDPRSSAPTICPQNNFCDGQRCVPAGGLRAPCRTQGRPCDAGLFCDNTVCRANQRPGDPCDTRDVACAPDAWCVSLGDSGVRGICSAFGAEGTPCRFADPPCEAGLVCDRMRVRCVGP